MLSRLDGMYNYSSVPELGLCTRVREGRIQAPPMDSGGS